MRQKSGLSNISEISPIVLMIITVIILISLNMLVSKDLNKGLNIYKTNRYLFIKPSSANEINNDTDLTNYLRNLIFKFYYCDQFFNNIYSVRNSSGGINKISGLNLFIHIQRNHLHIARLKAG